MWRYCEPQGTQSTNYKSGLLSQSVSQSRRYLENRWADFSEILTIVGDGSWHKTKFLVFLKNDFFRELSPKNNQKMCFFTLIPTFTPNYARDFVLNFDIVFVLLFTKFWQKIRKIVLMVHK